MTVPILVVTDLDGTLLDHVTYDLEPAREALRALRSRGAFLVLATSKTAAEVDVLAPRLDQPVAAIVENGGAVVAPAAFWPRGGHQPRVIRLGAPRESLVRALRQIAAETSASLRGFADCAPEDVARLTGLPLDQARLALAREYDEPFLLEDDAQLPAVAAAATSRGLMVTRGGRFHHLTGRSDKGNALRVLLQALARQDAHPFTVGLGDAANDLTFLQVVDRPVIVPRPGPNYDVALTAALPGALRAPSPGPAGWNRAVLDVLAALSA